jgi:hypothetical protein
MWKALEAIPSEREEGRKKKPVSERECWLMLYKLPHTSWGCWVLKATGPV